MLPCIRCVCIQVSRIEAATTMKKRRRTTIGKLCHLVEGCVHTEQCPHYLRRRNVAMAWQMLGHESIVRLLPLRSARPPKFNRSDKSSRKWPWLFSNRDVDSSLTIEEMKEEEKGDTHDVSTGFEARREPADRLDSSQT